jgi:hypothetical protein
MRQSLEPLVAGAFSSGCRNSVQALGWSQVQDAVNNISEQDGCDDVANRWPHNPEYWRDDCNKRVTLRAGQGAARPESPLLNRYEVVARVGVVIDDQGTICRY